MSGSDEQISSMGLSRSDGFSDLEDYISIESGRVITIFNPWLCICILYDVEPSLILAQDYDVIVGGLGMKLPFNILA